MKWQWMLLWLLVCTSGRVGVAQPEPASGAAAESDPPAAAATVPEAVLQAEQQRIDAIGRAVPSAVAVFVPGGGGGGSGVLISSDGYALTNFHVSSPAGVHMRCGLSDGKIYDAVIIGIDPVGDLALIRLLGRDDFPAAELADSDRVQVGDWCFVVGNPFLLATNLQPTVTWGLISGVGRYQYPSGTLLEYANCIQTDASINPGNSGGPIFDAQGRLIGIVGRASFEKRGRVNVGVGYAISINQAKNFLGYLHSGRIVDHATLGATVATDPDGGVRVSNILESSDAFRRGLRYGDEILEVGGRPVQTANDVQNLLGTYPKNWRIPLAFRHEGQTVRTLVRLGGVHRQDELLEKMAGAIPPPPPVPQPRRGQPKQDAPDGDPPGEADEPADGKKPADGKEPADGDRPADGKRAAADPHGGGDLPAAVADVYEARAGYANYYPNRQMQQRLWQAMRSALPPVDGDRSTGWVLRGTTADEPPRPVELTLSAGGAPLRMVQGDQAIELAADDAAASYAAVEQQSPVAVLTALGALQRMVQRGPASFGDTYYLGSMPLLGQLPLRDVLIGTAGDLETRFLLHPASQRVEAVEVFAGRDSDPAEILFRWPDSGNSPHPTALELRFGTQPLMIIKIDSWQSVASAS